MPYRSSSGLIVIVSAFAFVWGLWRLAEAGRWRLFAVVIASFFGYAALLYAIFLMPHARLRMWTAVVVVIGFPAWIMAGPIVYGISSRPERLLIETSANPVSRSIRYRGAIALFLSLTVWCYGALGSDFSRKLELVVLGVALYGFVIGGYWLLSGKVLV